MSKRCDFAIIVVHDPLAQLGERLGDNQKVDSSSLLRITSDPAICGVLLYRGIMRARYPPTQENRSGCLSHHEASGFFRRIERGRWTEEQPPFGFGICPTWAEPNVNVNLILYKKWKIILYNFQLFSGWLSRNARLSFSL